MGAGNSKQPLDHYTKEEIGAIVASYGSKYEQYGREAKENGIDGPLLASLTEDDFQEVLDDLNITSRMHRRKLVHVFRSALACSSVCSSLPSNTSASVHRGKRKPRTSITSINSFLSEGTISETETDGFSCHNNSGVVVFDMDHDQEQSHSQVMIEEFQALLDRQFEVNEALMKNVEHLEEESVRQSRRQKKSRPPQDRATIVLTDVEGSTALWEQNPSSMRRAIEMHDKIIRRCAAEQLGYEIDTEGDAFFFAFHEASDAVAFALTFQDELNDAPWSEEILALTDAGSGNHERRGLRVRVAMSVGEVETRANVLTERTQYLGPAWDFAKRIERISQGGQILTTDETWRAALRNLDMDRFEFPKVSYLGTHPVSWSGCTFDHILELAPAKLPLIHNECHKESCGVACSKHESGTKKRVQRVRTGPKRTSSGTNLKDLFHGTQQDTAKNSPRRPRRKSHVILNSLPLADIPDIDSDDEGSRGDVSREGSLGNLSDHISIIETGLTMF